MARDLSGYEEVPDRIRRFIEKHPDGSLQCMGVEYRDLPAAHLDGMPGLHIVYTAAAYRTPDDPRPGIGMASEPVPGLTPYTRGSELMNAETSAWGRALSALGFVGKVVASANEVRARQSGAAVADSGPMATVAQKVRLKKDLKFAKLETSEQQAPLWRDLTGLELPANKLIWDVATKTQAGVVISRLAQGAFPTGKSDVPVGADDFVQEPLDPDEPKDTPF